MNALEELYTNYQKCPYDYPFDLSQEPDQFGYFEVLMDRDGNIYEAPNGHTRGLVMMIARDQNITAEEVDAKSDVINYQEWLLKESEAIMIWYSFYTGYLNDKQKQAIDYLIEKGYMDKEAYGRQPAY